MSGNLVQANAIQIPLQDKSVQLCAFSPPYWKFRKYKIFDVQFPDGWIGQLGLEPSIDLFLDHMMLVMGEVWRILRGDGVVFVNLGDKMISKSLCLIPQKFAIRCQEAGWIVRSEIIWHKPNPMPESCKDRPTKAHEQVWMLTKQEKYFFDQEAIREPHKADSVARIQRGRSDNHKWSNGGPGNQTLAKDLTKACNPAGRNIRTVWSLPSESCQEAHFATWPSRLAENMIRSGSSPRACEMCGAPWVRIVEKTFVPQEDVSLERGIKGCFGQKPMNESNNWDGMPRGFNKTKTLGWKPTCKCDNKGIGRCVVLDPFVGTGTSVLMAERLGRIGVGLDLSSEYLWDIAKEKVEAPMQKEMF